MQKYIILFIFFNLSFSIPSISFDSSSLQDSNKYLPLDQFFYANNQRTTIDGSLPLLQSKIKPIPTAIFGVTVGGIFVTQHIVQMNSIWDKRTSFHFYEDGRYALYADKAGHFFGAYYTSYILSEALMPCGFSYDASTITGAILGLGYETYVEMLDGFSADWGFCPTDFYADVAGAGFFLAQHYVPFLQNFTPKFSYYPPRWHDELDRKPSKMFIDNYSAHTIWMSVNVHNLLPQNLKSYWPSWLELSVGYAARNLCDPFPPHGCNCDPKRSEQYYSDVWGNPKFLVGLDYNLVQLLPDGPPVWNWLKQTLNYIKLPSPTIEFGRETKFFLMYPFPINIGNIRF